MNTPHFDHDVLFGEHQPYLEEVRRRFAEAFLLYRHIRDSILADVLLEEGHEVDMYYLRNQVASLTEEGAATVIRLLDDKPAKSLRRALRMAEAVLAPPSVE